MPSQHPLPSYNSSKEWEYIQRTQLPYTDPKKIILTTGTTGADFPEVFIQLKVKNVENGNQ